MKRTAEIVMTVIGLILNLFGAIGIAVLTSVTHTDFFREGFEEGYNEGMIDPAYDTSNEINTILGVFSGLGWWVVIMAVLGFVAGIVAVFFLVGNKKPKAASIILIVTAIIIALGTLFLGFIPALLYLIAGIVGLVRKPPQEPIEPNIEL